MRISLSMFCLLAGLTLGARSARAEQIVIADVSYTHSEETTDDSHYFVMPQDGTPDNWASPVDFSQGAVHITLEVKTKPAGGTRTQFQLCFIGMPDDACSDQSPVYTETGKVEWTSRFENFWYAGDTDWSKGVERIALILKDDNNGKPAGDPKFMPTDLHVEIALLSDGATYVPPSTPSSNAGTGGAAGAANGGSGGSAAGADAGQGGASGSAAAAGSGGSETAGASGSKPDAGAAGRAGSSGVAAAVPPAPAAGSRATPPPLDAGTPADSADASSASQTNGQAESPVEGSSCRAAASASNDAWGLFLFVGLLVLQRRRARA